MLGLVFGLLGALVGVVVGLLAAAFGVAVGLLVPLSPVLFIILIVWLLVRSPKNSAAMAPGRSVEPRR